MICPGFYFHFACGDEGFEVEQFEGSLDKAVYSRFLQPYFLQKHLSVFETLQLCDVSFCFGCQHEHFGIFVFHCLAHFIHIFVSRSSTCFVNVADVKNGFCCQEEQVASSPLFIFCIKVNRACALALAECIVVFFQYAKLHFCCLVACVGLFLHFLYSLLHRFQVLNLQFCVDNFLISHGIHGSVDVRNIVVVKAAQHMNDCVALANVTQEFVSQPFALACAFHQSGNVNYFNCCWYYSPRVNNLCQFVESLVRNGDNSYVGLDGAKGEVGCLSLCARQAVEKGRLTNIWQSYYSTL